jgi:phosphoglycerate dehydrogenase-like enzyme
MKQFQEKIVVTTRAFSNNEYLRKVLLESFPNAKFNTKGKKLAGVNLVDFIADADAAIIGLEFIDAEVLSKLSHIKMIAKYGVGLDNINIPDCESYNVTIGWEAGVNRLSVAEMALGFMLGLSRNLYRTSYQLSKGKWNKSGGYQLSEKTIGIIGVGNIGKELIRLLKPFNCKLLVNDIIDQSSYYHQNNLIHVSKEELLAKSDIVSVHTPLNDEMSNFFDYNKFNTFKEESYFINTARGGLVVQNDLKLSLKEGLIAGAAIDVYDDEPPTDMDLLQVENLINTPHIGGNANEAVINMGLSAIKKLVQYFNK